MRIEPGNSRFRSNDPNHYTTAAINATLKCLKYLLPSKGLSFGMMVRFSWTVRPRASPGRNSEAAYPASNKRLPMKTCHWWPPVHLCSNGVPTLWVVWKWPLSSLLGSPAHYWSSMVLMHHAPSLVRGRVAPTNHVSLTCPSFVCTLLNLVKCFCDELLFVTSCTRDDFRV